MVDECQQSDLQIWRCNFCWLAAPAQTEHDQFEVFGLQGGLPIDTKIYKRRKHRPTSVVPAMHNELHFPAKPCHGRQAATGSGKECFAKVKRAIAHVNSQGASYRCSSSTSLTVNYVANNVCNRVFSCQSADSEIGNGTWYILVGNIVQWSWPNAVPRVTISAKHQLKHCHQVHCHHVPHRRGRFRIWSIHYPTNAQKNCM